MIGVLSYLVFFSIFALIFSIAVMGLNLQWGFAGLFNAGVVGFMAIGGYTTAILMGPAWAGQWGGFGLPFILALPGGMVMAGLAAWVIGRVTIRLRHEYLAIATFGIAITIQLIAWNTPSITGGTLGLIGLPKPGLVWFDDVLIYNIAFLVSMLALTGLVLWALQAITLSPWGRALKAIREDEEAARAVGKDISAFRLEAFVLGSMLMGMSGGLFAGFIGYVSPADFDANVTFQIWTMLILGGSANHKGAIAGAFVVWMIWTFSGWAIARIAPAELQAQAGAIQMMLIGFLLVGTLLWRPRGIIGEKLQISRHVAQG